MVRQWFAYASRDLKLAYGAIGYGMHFKNEAAFHAQQCIEKTMKGYLAFHAVRAAKIHDIAELAKLIKKIDAKLAVTFRNADQITAYAVAYRYPDSQVKPITFRTAKAAVNQAKRVYDRLYKEVTKS